MWLLSCVDQVVFLQVGQLGEVLLTEVALEWPLSTVDSEMHLPRENMSRDKHWNTHTKTHTHTHTQIGRAHV